MNYDHTDALSSPMLAPAPECPDPFAGLEPGDLTHVPGDYVPRWVESNPHTRVGY